MSVARHILTTPVVRSLAVSLLANTGCSLVVESSEAQCEQASDCAAQLTGTEGLSCSDGLCVVVDPWACAGVHPEPKPVAAPGTIRALTLDAQSGSIPVADVQLTPCAGDDPLCRQPVGPVAVSDADGVAEVRWEDARFGYVEVELEGHMPFLGLVSEQEKADGVFIETMPIFTRNAYNILVTLAGTVADTENLGFVAIAVQPCEGQSRAGVSVRISSFGDSTVAYYFREGVASTQPTATDANGYAGFLNVPPGSLTISGVVDGGRVIGHREIIVRPGWVTGATVFPNGPP